LPVSTVACWRVRPLRLCFERLPKSCDLSGESDLVLLALVVQNGDGVAVCYADY
jgi:hypothetical protein